MHLDDITISRAIIESYTGRLLNVLESDVAIVGGGPAGLVAAYYLAGAGIKTVVIERKLSVGGGMWGGGMMMNEIVVQEDALPIIKEFGIRYSTCRQEGYYTASSVESVAALTLKAVQSGATVMNLISAEDVMVREGMVAGLVLNWTPVSVGKFHVDPLVMQCRFTVDATGHDASVAAILARKLGGVLNTPSGGLEGEKPMWASRGEEQVVANTREVYPGLYVAGMAANAVCGGLRMGPVFGGMLLSGRKVAGEIISRMEG
ncbi:MAG: sulfide-dependent adenosine diphosphate thiazole synthase [Peptococcaceae bacterium]|nr:sulfide-dependent adenosine diphosphate thiazole synthase [Peptococcaceae bacterium]